MSGGKQCGREFFNSKMVQGSPSCLALFFCCLMLQWRQVFPKQHLVPFGRFHRRFVSFWFSIVASVAGDHLVRHHLASWACLTAILPSIPLHGMHPSAHPGSG